MAASLLLQLKVEAASKVPMSVQGAATQQRWAVLDDAENMNLFQLEACRTSMLSNWSQVLVFAAH